MPNTTRTVLLGDILNDTQIKEVTAILNKGLPDYEEVKMLKSYLAQFRDDLENKKQIVPEYLCYWIIYNRNNFVSGNHNN